MSVHGEMLTYGILKSDGALHHIDDSFVSGGKTCNCECPECGEPLIAKNRSKPSLHSKAHHFAHISGRECHYAPMTALHRLAQQILERNKKVMLPAFERQYVTRKAEVREFNKVVLEQVWKDESSTRRPDCTCFRYDGKNPLWVEIYCRHKVDSVREEDIKNKGVYCIEIDFNDLLESGYTEEDVLNRLTKDTKHRRWVSCPELEKENEALRLKALEDARLRDKVVLAQAQDKLNEKARLELILQATQKEGGNQKKNFFNFPHSATLSNEKMYMLLDMWKDNESDIVARDLIKELWRAPKEKIDAYQNPLEFKNYLNTLHKNIILTQGETYELWKYAILCTIGCLERDNRQDLIEAFLTKQALRQKYLILVSFQIEHPLLFNVLRIDDLRQSYPELWRAYKDATRYGWDNTLKEIWDVVNT